MNLVPKNVRPLSDDEQEYLDSNRTAMAQMCQELFDPPQDVTIEALDAIFTWWIENFDSDKEDPSELVMGIGIAFCDLLAVELDLDWVVAEFETESELAVHDEVANSFLYPFSLIGKRFDTKEKDCLQPLFKTLLTQVAAMREIP